MVNKLSDMSPIQTEDYVTKFGNWNELPPNWREVTEKEIVQNTHFSFYSPQAIEYRQLVDPNVAKYIIGVKIYTYHDNTGIAYYPDVYAGKIYWFRFGCEHEYRELSFKECAERKIYHAGKCFHVSECSKCKYVRSVDSSD